MGVHVTPKQCLDILPRKLTYRYQQLPCLKGDNGDTFSKAHHFGYPAVSFRECILKIAKIYLHLAVYFHGAIKFFLPYHFHAGRVLYGSDFFIVFIMAVQPNVPPPEIRPY